MGSHRWFIWTFIITKWWISYKTRDAKALPFKQANSPFRKLYTSLWCPLSVSRGSKKELLNAIQKNSWPTDFGFLSHPFEVKKPFFTTTWGCWHCFCHSHPTIPFPTKKSPSINDCNHTKPSPASHGVKVMENRKQTLRFLHLSGA